MTVENDIFKKYTADFEKLKEYGFVKKKDVFLFQKNFRNDEFRAEITVLKSGEVSGKVYETENNDEFLPLKIETRQGAFIGEIREEYKKILTEIRDNCFSQNYFISNQANRITNMIIKKYGDYPDFMWEKFPQYGVFKNNKSLKWYGLISNIEFSKLGGNNCSLIEIMNLKLNKDKIQKLLEQKGYYPAWHMNKKTWITITLDETLNDNEIMDLIEESYSYTIEPNKNWIIPANPKYFDLEAAFEKENEILWKQSSKIKKGDFAYIYVANPVSAILYKCEITKTDMPYNYKDKNIKIDKVIKIKLLKKYNKDFMTFEKLNKYGIKAIRGQRTCPENLCKILK